MLGVKIFDLDVHPLSLPTSQAWTEPAESVDAIAGNESSDGYAW